MSDIASTQESDSIDGSPVLLGAAASLRYFTVRELAGHAGVSIEAARSFLRRSDVIERIHAAPTTGQRRRGPPEARWQVRPERRDELAERLAEISRAITPAFSEVTEEAARMESGPTPLELLRGSLHALAAGDDPGSPEQVRGLVIAAHCLSAVRADIEERRALALPVTPEEEQALAEAATTLARLRAPAVITLSAAEPNVAVDAVTRDTLTRFLRDWTVTQLQGREVDAEVATQQLRRYAPSDLVEHLLSSAAGLEPAAAAMAPGATLLTLRRGWTQSWSAETTTVLAERLAAIAAGGDACDLPGVAVLLAVLNARRLAGDLARALLASSALALENTQRRTCLFALARLARPLPDEAGRDTQWAAVASYYLLTLGQEPEEELPALAPAVLAAPLIDAGGVLIRLGRSAFDAEGLVGRFREWVDEATMLRNLALVLQQDGFRILKQHFKSVVDSPAAEMLLLSLKRHDAIDWREGDVPGEVIIRLGETVHAACGSGERIRYTLTVDGRETRDRISRLQTTYALYSARSEPPVVGSSLSRRLAMRSQLRVVA